MEPSKFQKAIYKIVEQEDCNLMISAVAGSGKTTTLIECLKIIPPRSSAGFLAFNNSIVDELKKRVKRKDVHITTIHSLCWRALMKQNNFKCELKPNKSIKYINIICKKNKIPSERNKWFLYVFSKMLDLMRQNLLFSKEEIMDLADRHSFSIGEDEAIMLMDTLSLMNSNYKDFDFTDMIYRCILDNVRLPKFDFVFVDESQDLSRLQQSVVRRIKSRKGRMIAVGDPNQAIYGFAGADVGSYFRMKELFPNTVELPLSVNYRCGIRIIVEARKINNKIIAYKGNKKGEVRNGLVNEIKGTDWVLCRNVKPLVLTNLYLLSKGIKSFVKGSDIGVGLVAIVNRAGTTTTSSVISSFKSSVERERLKLIKKGVKNPDNTEKIEMMKQKLDILTVLSEGVSTTKQLNEKIRGIFKEKGVGVCLSTIHKSKGLENDTIFFLCPELIPSKFAEQPWEFQQEKNLEYVAITRAKLKLIYISDYESVVELNKEILKN